MQSGDLASELPPLNQNRSSCDIALRQGLYGIEDRRVIKVPEDQQTGQSRGPLLTLLTGSSSRSRRSPRSGYALITSGSRSPTGSALALRSSRSNSTRRKRRHSV
jgi:hypothetical protein